MRGKKTDPIFIAEFISEAVRHGMETTDEIVQDAKKKIAQIDQEIKAMEAKKILRSKLLDVIASFEKTVSDKSGEAKLLSFFKLDYPNTCKQLCNVIANKGSIDIGNKSATSGSGETFYSIKQLLDCKVLTRAGHELNRGERFDEYMKFVLRE